MEYNLVKLEKVVDKRAIWQEERAKEEGGLAMKLKRKLMPPHIVEHKDAVDNRTEEEKKIAMEEEKLEKNGPSLGPEGLCTWVSADCCRH